jgi:hypothetical protein
VKPMDAFDPVTRAMNSFGLKGSLRRLLLVLLLALPPLSTAAEPRNFASPQAAVDALIAALNANDEAALLALFGDKHKGLVSTGDPESDAAERANAAKQIAVFHLLEDRGPDRRVLLMGAEAWPMPIPLVRSGSTWHFATAEGVQELMNRRVGANERNAIHVLRAYLDAQRDYASRDRDGDGVLQYARKLGSSPGKQDGLYWPADTAKGEEPSPFGPLIAERSAYLRAHKGGDDYRGYHFRILTGQGKSAAGGAYSYIINGRMVAGFAMVAYPAQYGVTGVMTFIVNHNGKIYQKDLGPGSAAVGAKMKGFDPGKGWEEVTP